MRKENNLYVLSENNSAIKELLESFGNSLKYILNIGNRKYNKSKGFNYRQYSHYNAYITRYHEISKLHDIECPYLNNTPKNFYKLMMSGTDHNCIELVESSIEEILWLLIRAYKLNNIWCEVALFEDAYTNFDDYESFEKNLYSKYTKEDIQIISESSIK